MRGTRRRIVVGSGLKEDHWIRNPIAYRTLGVWRFGRVIFDIKSREVSRAKVHVDMHCLKKGVNTLLNSRISWIHGIRVGRLDASTCGVANSEKRQGRIQPGVDLSHLKRS
jgi:hypothetical protein